MTLTSLTIAEVKWLAVLSGRIRRVAPIPFTMAVAAFSAGEVFLLLSVLMPLKVILLVAQDGIPWYLQQWVTPVNKDAFVLALALGAIASYGLHHFCNYLVKLSASRGAEHIQSNTRKLDIFANQQELAEGGFTRLVRVFGSGLLIFALLAAGCLINPTIFGLLVGLIALEYTVIALLVDPENVNGGSSINSVFVHRPRVGVNVLASTNFLIAFAFLLLQFLGAQQLGAVIAILSIILARQLMQRLGSLIGDVIYLAENKLRLRTLYFPSIRYLPSSDKQQHEFLHALAPAMRQTWLEGSLSDVLGHSVHCHTSRWIDSESPATAYLDVVASASEEGESDGPTSRFLVKCYSNRHALRAAHEFQLLSSHPTTLPACPKFLGEGFLDSNRLLMFRGADMELISPPAWRKARKQSLVQLWGLTLEPELVEAYTRTHSLITDRLNDEAFAQIEVAAEEPEERDVLGRLVDVWPSLRAEVRRLPLVLRNPSLFVRNHWVVDDTDTAYCLSWSNWTIEPMGFEPSLYKQESELLKTPFPDWDVGCTLPAVDSPSMVHVVAYLAALEDAINKKHMKQALEIANKVLNAWNEAQEQPNQVAMG